MFRQCAIIWKLLFAELCWAASVRAQTIVWTQPLTVNSAVESSLSVAVDPAGDVYAAGCTFGTALGSSSSSGIWGYAAKYSASGTMLWGQVWGNGNQSAVAISCDAAGDAFVVTDGGLTKYGPAGNVLWTWNSLQPWYEAVAVAVDGSGNAYVTGADSLPPENDLVVKLTPAGQVAWTTTLNAYGTRPAVIAVNAVGDVAIANSNGGSAFIANLNPAGNVVWSQTYSPGASLYWGGVGIDGSANVYATINSGAPLFGSGLPDRSDYLVKYGPSGNVAWDATFGEDSWWSSLAHRSGRVCVCGRRLWTDTTVRPVRLARQIVLLLQQLHVPCVRGRTIERCNRPNF